MRSEARPNVSIPVRTHHAARKVYNLQHVYLRIGDQLQDLLMHVDLSLLDPTASRGGETTLRLALVTAFQYAESLSDQDASEYSLRRMDWKYALYLPIHHPGIRVSALCEFRKNLYAFPNGLPEFAIFLNQLDAYGLYSRINRPDLTPAIVLSSICEITRIDTLNKAMRSSLSMLISSDPEWLRDNLPPYWYERYRPATRVPQGQLGQADLLEETSRLGADIQRLLSIVREKAPGKLAEQPEMQNLVRLFDQQFACQADRIQWRTNCEPCACSDRQIFQA